MSEAVRTYPSELPVVALRQIVVFPLTLQPLAVNRPASMESVNRALSGDRLLFLALQNNDSAEDPEPDDVRRIGTIAAVRQMARAPNGGVHIIVEGLMRANADIVTKNGASLRATVNPVPEPAERTLEVDAYVRRLQELVERGLSIAAGLSQDLRGMVSGIDEPLRLSYLLANLLDMKAEDKQQILETDQLVAKLQAVAAALSREISLLELKSKIETETQEEMTDAQRQYYLRQQLKTIQDELGEGEKTDFEEVRKRIRDAQLPEAVAPVAAREVERLERTPSGLARPSDDPHVHRLGAGRALVDGDRRSPRSGRRAPGARRRSLRSRQGQGTHRRVPGRAEAEIAAVEGRLAGGDDQGADPVLRRATRRRQDVARPVHRAGDEPQVRAHLARRRARRGGNPRTPPHLHRLHSRPHRAGAETGRRHEPRVHAGRARQAQRRIPGRSRGGAARGARSGAEPLVPRSLPRNQHGPVARPVHRDGQPARPGTPGAARSHGDHLARRLHGGRKAPHRDTLPCATPARGACA